MEQLKKISGIEKAVAEMVTDLEAKKKEITESLTPYIKGVVTEDTLDAWKKDRATLNKNRTAYETERKGIESGWKENLKPLLCVYGEIKTAYTEAIDNIDQQTKEFEAKRIAEKKAHIKELFDSVPVPEDIAGWLSLEDLYNPKWENKTAKDKDITSEVEKAYMDTMSNVTTIKLMNHKYEADGLEVLKSKGTLQQAIAKMNDLTAQEERVKAELERQQREADERARQKELEAQQEAERMQKELEALAEAVPELDPPKPEEVVIDIFGTPDDFGTPEVQEEPTHKYMLMLNTTAEMTSAEAEDMKRTLYRLGFDILSMEVIG